VGRRQKEGKKTHGDRVFGTFSGQGTTSRRDEEGKRNTDDHGKKGDKRRGKKTKEKVANTDKKGSYWDS